MAYTPPLPNEQLKKAVSRFQRFFFVSVGTIALTVLSMWLFPDFWNRKILWGLGSLITVFAVVSNRYFDIKKNANTRNQAIDSGSFYENSKLWLKIEKVLSYAWAVGAAILVVTKWIDY